MLRRGFISAIFVGISAFLGMERQKMEKIRPNYVFPVRSFEMVDGDTYKFLVDCGFGVFREAKVRLADVDTPEVGHPGCTEASRAAYSWLSKRARVAQGLFIRTRKTSTGRDVRSFVRYVADVFDGQGNSLADFLVEEGYARKVR